METIYYIKNNLWVVATACVAGILLISAVIGVFMACYSAVTTRMRELAGEAKAYQNQAQALAAKNATLLQNNAVLAAENATLNIDKLENIAIKQAMQEIIAHDQLTILNKHNGKGNQRGK